MVVKIDRKNGRETLANILLSLIGRGGLVAGTFHHVGGKGPDEDHKEWAKILRVREESGEDLSIVQKDAWRAALGVEK